MVNVVTSAVQYEAVVEMGGDGPIVVQAPSLVCASVFRPHGYSGPHERLGTDH